jgi:hypothetical protein
MVNGRSDKYSSLIPGRNYKTVPNFVKAKGNTRYCGLVRGPHVEK